MVRQTGAAFITLLMLFAEATASRAQVESPARRAALGAAVGVAGGAVITVSAIVARARFQKEYIDSVDDLIHWQSIPMIAAPAAGIIFGLAGQEAHVGSMVGSSAGMLAGAAVGAGVGWLLSTQREAPWAGAVIGAGVGLTVGGLTGGLLAWSRDEDPELEFPSSLRFSLSVPVP